MNQNPIIPTPNKNLCEPGNFSFHAVHNTRIYKENDPHIDDTHIHPFYEIYVNKSGNVSFLINQTITKLQKGDIIFSSPGTFHHCLYHEFGIHEHFCVWFQVDGNNSMADFLRENLREGFHRLNASRHEELFDLLEELTFLSDQKGQVFEKSVTFFSLLQLLSHSEHNEENHEKPNLPDKFQEMLDYVNHNFTSIHDVKEIAHACHTSTATMNRLFRQYLQLSPHQLLTSRRMSYAERLLQEGYTVTESCFSAGFSDCSHFIAAFKKVYGLTPYQYKKQL